MRDSSASDHPARNAAAHAAARTCTASSSALEAAASLRTVSTLADSNSSANRTACSTISAMTRTLAHPPDTPRPDRSRLTRSVSRVSKLCTFVPQSTSWRVGPCSGALRWAERRRTS
jgi:hypothetical protein